MNYFFKYRWILHMHSNVTQKWLHWGNLFGLPLPMLIHFGWNKCMRHISKGGNFGIICFLMEQTSTGELTRLRAPVPGECTFHRVGSKVTWMQLICFPCKYLTGRNDSAFLPRFTFFVILLSFFVFFLINTI